MRFTGALNRRRAYAAAHPIVISAEQQLHEALTAVLAIRPVLTIGVAHHELLIDGETYVSPSSLARELATRLHRRGVGAVSFQAGVPLLQLRETLAWLVQEQPAATDSAASHADLPPVLTGVNITRVAYDQLTLGDVERAADASGQQLWNTLAHLAGDAGSGTSTDTSGVATRLRESLHKPDDACKTAIAFMDLAAQGAAAPVEGRARIGEQLNRALETLGESSFGPVIRSLGEKALQQRFVSQVVDVLPVATVASWVNVAAQSQEQQISHHMLRLMSRLSNFAEAQQTTTAATIVRGAAQNLVKGWSLEDPTPEEHVALLDRIALHERARTDIDARTSPMRTAIVETSRLVQMALEIDVGGDDADAAAEALLAAGASCDLMKWAYSVGATRTARRLLGIVTSEKACVNGPFSAPCTTTTGRDVPMLEVEAIVHGLALTIRREHDVMLPLLDLRTFDEYTTTHSCNVAMLPIGLSEALGLSDSDARAIGTAALLHDIGKMKLPQEVLTKPGKLTAAERLLIETHPVEGARILSGRGLGNGLNATVAYEHHIWCDGNGGYPGFAFPRTTHYASRIVHVCDIYDALCSKRPYRAAWSREKAITLIDSITGIELDPTIAPAFVDMLRSATLERHHLEAVRT